MLSSKVDVDLMGTRVAVRSSCRLIILGDPVGVGMAREGGMGSVFTAERESKKKKKKTKVKEFERSKKRCNGQGGKGRGCVDRHLVTHCLTASLLKCHNLV